MYANVNLPFAFCNCRTHVETENTNLENQISVTVVFPDSTLPTNLNGGFATQEAFRDYVLKCHQDSNWKASMHTRPTAERVADYAGGVLAKAFPIVFPFGHSGGAEDPALDMIRELRKKKKCLIRSREHVLKKYLRHGKPAFHKALFNLIVANSLMKAAIFVGTRIHANYKHSDGETLASKFGSMQPEQLNRAVMEVRRNHSAQFSSRPENQFLRSIYATCRDLPHTNEASQEARKQYFSFVAHFGSPAVFLTVTPDDGRNYRIVLFSLSDTSRANLPHVNPAAMSEAEIMQEYKFRQGCRTSYPGFCAEEYHRIMTNVIKHLFQWDVKKQESTGQGCFGKLLAWCQATEEQGRKTLHGHFLLFVEHWQPLMRDVQMKDNDPRWSMRQRKKLIQFCSNISSARLCADFAAPNGLLNEHPIFTHANCRTNRGKKRKRPHPICNMVDEQNLREMRHKKKCKIHCGFIGTCPICNHEYKMNMMITSALRHHLGLDETYQFPDKSRRLEQIVYGLQHDNKWYEKSAKEIALRLFLHNVLVNLHNITHATRCFKRSLECYANLPEKPLESDTIHYKDEPDIWFDFKGEFEKRFIFRYYPKRNIEDVFMNVHSPLLTKCFANNTNVNVAMNGPVVLYVTGYQAKQQQEEEKQAYTKVFDGICKMIRKANEADALSEIPPCQQGFRFVLAGIHLQTNAHVTAAPMAHYLALHGSRFRFSHDSHHLAIVGIENYLLKKDTICIIRMVNGTPMRFHKAMDYIFRPKEMEGLNILQCCQQLESIFIKEAEKRQIEYFEFTEGHPFCKTHCIVYRANCKGVATFPWTWIGSTAEFENPLTTPVEAMHKDFEAREEYCRRFSILFIPFRDLKDLKKDFDSFQEAFASLVVSGHLTEEVTRFANNIQDLHNSIRVTLPKNMLTLTTHSEEEESDETVHNRKTNEEQEAQFLANIATILAQTENPTNDSPISVTNITPLFIKNVANVTPTFAKVGATAVMTTDKAVYEFTKLGYKKPKDPSDAYVNPFRTTVIALNTLVLNALVVPENEFPTNQTDDATGSVASILAWCKNDRLDKNQQIAVEIMVATYILTFYENAEGEDVLDQLEGLQQLARRKPNNPETLRMFITGPAGAGKCK